jgi:hypothetical protein
VVFGIRWSWPWNTLKLHPWPFLFRLLINDIDTELSHGQTDKLPITTMTIATIMTMAIKTYIRMTIMYDDHMVQISHMMTIVNIIITILRTIVTITTMTI